MIVPTDKDVEKLRQDIDVTDRELVRLIEHRLALASKIGEMKRLKGSQNARFEEFYRPHREIGVLRRILATTGLTLPKVGWVRIWREIISSALQVQSPFRLAVCELGESPDLAVIARDHFGLATPIKFFQRPQFVLSELTSDRAELGLIPSPTYFPSDGWWLYMNAPLYVVGRLPILAKATMPKCLLIGRFRPEESGDDRTLIACSTNHGISQERLLSEFAAAGIEASLLDRQSIDGRTHYLLELEGYLPPDYSGFATLSENLALETRWVGAFANAIQAE